jgi:ubiquinone/menaquinone biosynthesis C-methylase UbiE
MIKIPPKKYMDELSAADPRQEIFCASRYYSLPFKYLYIKRLKMALKLLKGKKCEKMLDIGFGSGIFLSALSEKTEKLFGIDCHSHVDLVKKLMEKAGINADIREGNILEIPFEDNSFDCISCLSVLEFIKDTGKAIAEISRVAKPGAKIIIGAPVAGKLTNFGYRLIGKKEQNQSHKSDHQKIIRSVKKYANIEKIKTLPNFLPLNYSLFFVLSARIKK